jgi:hypothetical protein
MYIIDMLSRTSFALLLTLACLATPISAHETSMPPFARPVFVNPVPAHFADFWWRDFRDPTYCRMVLCRGSCAFRGDSPHSACTLVPLFPILQTEDCCKDSGCDSR